MTSLMTFSGLLDLTAPYFRIHENTLKIGEKYQVIYNDNNVNYAIYIL